MSSSTLETGPLLVSDLPPVSVPSQRLRTLVQTRIDAARSRRALQRALRTASHSELSDLIAQARRG
jgi:hypothetical protein